MWDRLAAQQPQCGYCALGLSCRNCAMGPCRIDPFGEGPQKGVCGADADVIVARNLGRTIAAGSSSHSDHGRDILEAFGHLARGETTGYHIADEEKLRRLADEVGRRRPTAGPPNDVAVDLADVLLEDYGTRRGSLSFVATCTRGAPRQVGRRSASRPGASTGRTSRCSTAPTWGSTTTT